MVIEVSIVITSGEGDYRLEQAQENLGELEVSVLESRSYLGSGYTGGYGCQY